MLGVTGLYFWYKGAIKTADMAKALVFPLAGVAAFWGYLCYYDMAALYYASNYTFNLNLVQGFEMTRIVDFPPYMAVLMWLGFFGAAAAVVCKTVIG